MREDVIYRALNFHVRVFLSSTIDEANKVVEMYFEAFFAVHEFLFQQVSLSFCL